MGIDWSFLSAEFKQRVFEKGDARQKEWLREWRMHRKIGNLKKRMPSKKKRKKYYEQVLKINIRK